MAVLSAGLTRADGSPRLLACRVGPGSRTRRSGSQTPVSQGFPAFFGVSAMVEYTFAL
jgi:hypothetical protein